MTARRPTAFVRPTCALPTHINPTRVHAIFLSRSPTIRQSARVTGHGRATHRVVDVSPKRAICAPDVVVQPGNLAKRSMRACVSGHVSLSIRESRRRIPAERLCGDKDRNRRRAAMHTPRPEPLIRPEKGTAHTAHVGGRPAARATPGRGELSTKKMMPTRSARSPGETGRRAPVRACTGADERSPLS